MSNVIKSLLGVSTILKADEAKGTVIAVVNTGNISDRQKDTMSPGCWRKVIGEGQQPAIIWGHQVDPPDVRGKVTRLEELPPGDPRVPLNQKAGAKGSGKASGLMIHGQFAMETQGGREAFALVKGGYIKQWSVQFSIADDGEESDGAGGRRVKLVDELFECSPVLIGASPGTALLAAKAVALAQATGAAETDPAQLAQAIHDLTTGLSARCPDLDIEKALDLIRQTLVEERRQKDADDTFDFEAIAKDEDLPADRVALMLQESETKARFQMDDGKYPIDNCSDVSDAWKLRGRSNSHSSESVARHVRRAAQALKCDGPWNDGKALDLATKHDKPGKGRVKQIHDAAMQIHDTAAALGGCSCNDNDDQKSTRPGPEQAPAHVLDLAELLGQARAAGALAAHHHLGETAHPN